MTYPVQAPRRPYRRSAGLPERVGRRRGPVAILGAVALLGLALYSALLVHDVRENAATGSLALQQGLRLLTTAHLSALRPLTLARATADFRRAEAALTQARRRLGVWGDLALAHGAALPGPLRQVQALPLLLDVAQQIAGAAAEGGAALQPALTALYAASVPASPVNCGVMASSKSGEGVLVRLSTAMRGADPALARAQAQLDHAWAARQRLRGLPLPAGVAPLLAALDRRWPEAHAALLYARRLPALLGVDRPRYYLFLYQDPDDLRANGGYVGSASLAVLDHGHLTQIDYADSKMSALQVPRGHSYPPPPPLFYYQTLGSLELRDANYWPDFPTSAAQITRIYATLTHHRLDGVVALQPALVSYLLAVTGPLRLPGFAGVVTSANAQGRLQYYTHDQPGVRRMSDQQRKRFIVVLNHALLRRLLDLQPRQLDAVVTALQRATLARALLVTISDPAISRALRAAHWDGALRDDPGDYLAVYDQNMTDTKIGPYIGQRIDYQVQRRANGSLLSRVTITYRNSVRGVSLWIPRTVYQDYLRVGVPVGSVPISQVGFDDTFWPPEHEHGRLLIPGGLQVPGHSTRAVRLTYVVPAAVLRGVPGYRLIVQEQPGGHPAWVTVRVSAGGRAWSAAAALAHDLFLSTSWQAPSGALSVTTAR